MTVIAPSEAQFAAEIGRIFRDKRQKIGLALADVANATGISITQINRLETGQILKPNIFHFITLANFYQVPYAELMGQAPTGGPDLTTVQLDFLTLAEAVARKATPDQLAYAQTFLRMFNIHLSEVGKTP